MACFTEKEWVWIDAGESPDFAMRKHLESCPQCRSSLEERQKLAGALSRPVMPSYPEAFWDDLHAGVMAALPEKPEPFWKRIGQEIRIYPKMAWGMGLAVAVGLFIGFYERSVSDTAAPSLTEATEWTIDPVDAIRALDDTLPVSDAYAAQKLDPAEVLAFFENAFTLEETVSIMDSAEIKQVAILLAGR